MKKNSLIIILLSFFIVLSSCSELRLLEFLKPFKCRTVNLTNHLGESFSTLSGKDTIDFKVYYNSSNHYNTIVEDNDTFFEGTVNKLRGMYLLNTLLENGNYMIYAISFDNSTITGLGTMYGQSDLIIEDLKEGKYAKSIIDTSDQYIIYPNRRTGARMFRSALSNLDAMEFVVDEELNEIISNPDFIQDEFAADNTNEAEQQIKVYPNPVIDKLNVELDFESPKCEYILTDISGRQLRSGYLSNGKGQIDCSSLYPGSYFLVFENQKKVVKLLKK